MRIIAGSRKGTIIAAPRGLKTRPTADKVREAVFSMLGDVTGLVVLDLFAGSGALGLEAISRGAARADLVDSRTGAIRTMGANIEKLRFENATAIRRDYLAFLKAGAKKERRYNLIFVDPPYRMHRVIEPHLNRWLPQVAATGGKVVVESSLRQGISLPLKLLTEKVYGDIMIRIHEA